MSHDGAAAFSVMILPNSAGAIVRCAELLRKGELVAFPTETVYGLGGDATNDLAIAKVFAMKDRPDFNPLIVHIPGVAEAMTYAHFSEMALRLAEKFWPGPLTLVLPCAAPSPLSLLALAGLDTVALRAPSHPLAQALIKETDRPIAAPSANPSGRLSATHAQHVAEYFPELAVLNGGQSERGIESTILHVTADEAVLLREGPLTREDIEKAVTLRTQTGHAIRSPGQLLRHYAPRHRLRLDVQEVEPDEKLLAFGPGPYPGEPACNLSPAGDLTEAAANLFSMLHRLDREAAAGIAVMPIPNDGIGRAINDRLRRGAYVASGWHE
ncbi:MAG TPA: L-threonylcarbamoyladenylate synthase [Dongiaceae bacterium]|nr:L-threonylcarbamoyladenylate synthase [Dongiaceae bacterium]